LRLVNLSAQAWPGPLGLIAALVFQLWVLPGAAYVGAAPPRCRLAVAICYLAFFGVAYGHYLD